MRQYLNDVTFREMSRWFLVVNFISSISLSPVRHILLQQTARSWMQIGWYDWISVSEKWRDMNGAQCLCDVFAVPGEMSLLFRVKLDSLRSTFNMQILRLVMLIMVWNRRWNRMRTNWPWNNFNVMVRIVMNWVVKPVMDWKNWIMWFVMDRNWVVDQRLMMMMICSPWGGPPRVQWLASIWVPTGHWTPWFIYDPRSWLGFLLIFDLFFFGKCAQRQRTEAHNFQQLEWRIRVVNNNSIFTNSMQRYKRWTCFLVYCSILRY